MKENNKKLGFMIIIVTIILILISNIAISYYKNNIVLKNNGTLVKDNLLYYNVKNAVYDYFELLTNKNRYSTLEDVILNMDEFTKEIFENIVSSYYGFDMKVNKMYDLGDNTYRCEYVVTQPPEALEGFLNYEDLMDENIYNNIVVIKFNKEFTKYKVIYNKMELKGGNVYEE